MGRDVDQSKCFANEDPKGEKFQVNQVNILGPKDEYKALEKQESN